MGGRHSGYGIHVKHERPMLWIRFRVEADSSYRKSQVYLLRNDKDVSPAARKRHTMQQEPFFETDTEGEFCDVLVQQAESNPMWADDAVMKAQTAMGEEGYAVLQSEFRDFGASQREAQRFMKQIEEARQALGWKLLSQDFDFIEFEGAGVSSLHTDAEFGLVHPLVAVDEISPATVRQAERFWVARIASGKRLLLLDVKKSMAEPDWADEMKDAEAVKRAVLRNWQYFRVSPLGASVLFSSIGLRMTMHAGVSPICSDRPCCWHNLLGQRQFEDVVTSAAIPCLWDVTQSAWAQELSKDGHVGIPGHEQPELVSQE